MTKRKDSHKDGHPSRFTKGRLREEPTDSDEDRYPEGSTEKLKLNRIFENLNNNSAVGGLVFRNGLLVGI